MCENNFTSDEINEMANSLDLFTVISSYQPCIRRSGEYWMFHCNNNSDTDPSLCVNRKTNRYKCYSDENGSNALAYLIYEQHMSYKDAANEIISMCGVAPSRRLSRPSAEKFFRQCSKLKAEKKAIERVYGDYISDYGALFDVESPQEWIDEGMLPEVMRRFDIRIDRRGDRIVYPVYDASDRFICAKGRTRIENFKQLGLQKYINYNKIGTTDFFVGMKQNRESILRENRVIIFEGLKSVMKLVGWGDSCCVAAETSSLNEDQLRILIQMHIRDITIAFDQDKSLKQVKSTLEMLPRFSNVYVVNDKNGLLEKKDSPVDEGKEVWETLFRERVRIKY